MSNPDEFEDPPSNIPAAPARGGIPQPQAQIPQTHAVLLAIPGVCGVGETCDSQGGKVLEAYLEQAETVSRIPRQVQGIPVQTRVVGRIIPRTQ